MHGVVVEGLGFDGAEGADADMQSDVSELDSFFHDRIQHGLIKMQARGGGGYRAGGLGVDRLVAVQIFSGVCVGFIPLDVRGQRSQADFAQCLQRINRFFRG